MNMDKHNQVIPNDEVSLPDKEIKAAASDSLLSEGTPRSLGNIVCMPNSGVNNGRRRVGGRTISSRPDLRAQSSIPPGEFYGFGGPHFSPQGARIGHTPPPSSPPTKARVTTSAHVDRIDIYSDSDDERSDNGRQKSSPPKLTRTLPLYDNSISQKVRRHQSMPAPVAKSKDAVVEARDQETLDMIKGLVSLREEIVHQRMTDETVAPVRARTPEPPAKKKLSMAERKRRWPELTKNVPPYLRRSDAELLQYAKIISPLERHRSAPYAFRYDGRLRAEYKHLRVAAAIGGLTPLELNRL